MCSWIKDVLIISILQDLPLFEKLLGNGEKLDCNFQYAVQEEPNVLA
jgi:glucose-1-phosphate thymidylyltransferase